MDKPWLVVAKLSCKFYGIILMMMIQPYCNFCQKPEPRGGGSAKKCSCMLENENSKRPILCGLLGGAKVHRRCALRKHFLQPEVYS